MSTISDKLKIKPEMNLLIINAPTGYIKELNLPVKTDLAISPEEKMTYNFIQLFANSSADVMKYFPGLLKQLMPEGLLWTCYRKKTKDPANDLLRDSGWEAITSQGWRPVALVAVDEEWTSVRWKRIEDVIAKPKKEYPEIDRVNRLVHLPADLKAALDKAKLTERFGKLSFTHKKEYVEVVLEAKKPETRRSRIIKIIEMIRKLK